MPETAVPSQPCKRCLGTGLNEEAARRWHFQCPNWSCVPGTGTWGWALGSFGVRPGEGFGRVVSVPGTMAAGVFRVAALAWTAARSDVCPDNPATVPMRSWASSNTRRYQGSLFAVADFEEECTLTARPSICLSENLSAKVSSGVARWTLRNVVSAVRGAEDLGHLPFTVLPLHWRLAKGGLSSGRQPYFSPPDRPSWPRQRAPVSNILRWDSGVSATCSGCECLRRPPLHCETCKYPAWLPSSLQKWGGRRKRDASRPMGSWLGCLSPGSGG